MEELAANKEQQGAQEAVDTYSQLERMLHSTTGGLLSEEAGPESSSMAKQDDGNELNVDEDVNAVSGSLLPTELDDAKKDDSALDKGSKDGVLNAVGCCDPPEVPEAPGANEPPEIGLQALNLEEEVSEAEQLANGQSTDRPQDKSIPNDEGEGTLAADSSATGYSTSHVGTPKSTPTSNTYTEPQNVFDINLGASASKEWKRFEALADDMKPFDPNCAEDANIVKSIHETMLFYYPYQRPDTAVCRDLFVRALNKDDSISTDAINVIREFALRMALTDPQVFGNAYKRLTAGHAKIKAGMAESQWHAAYRLFGVPWMERPCCSNESETSEDSEVSETSDSSSDTDTEDEAEGSLKSQAEVKFSMSLPAKQTWAVEIEKEGLKNCRPLSKGDDEVLSAMATRAQKLYESLTNTEETDPTNACRHFEKLIADAFKKEGHRDGEDAKFLREYAVCLAQTHPSVYSTLFSSSDDDGHLTVDLNNPSTSHWLGAHLYFGNPWKPVEKGAYKLESLLNLGLPNPRAGDALRVLGEEKLKSLERTMDVFKEADTHLTKCLRAGEFAAACLNVDVLDFLFFASQEEVALWDYTSGKFPDLPPMRDGRMKMIEEVYEKIRGNKNAADAAADKEAGFRSSRKSLVIFKTWRNYLRLDRTIHWNMLHMYPNMDKETLATHVEEALQPYGISEKELKDGFERLQQEWLRNRKRKETPAHSSVQRQRLFQQSLSHQQNTGKDNSTENAASPKHPGSPLEESASTPSELNESDSANTRPKKSSSTPPLGTQRASARIAGRPSASNSSPSATAALSTPKTPRAKRAQGNPRLGNTDPSKKPKLARSAIDRTPHKLERLSIDHALVDWEAERPGLRPPVKSARKQKNGAVAVYKKPGDAWIKQQYRKLSLINHLLDELWREDRIRAPRERRALYVDEALGGSENGGVPVERQFVCLIKAIMFELKPNKTHDDKIRSLLVQMKEHKLFTTETSSDPGNAELIKNLFKAYCPRLKFEWLQPLATTLEEKHSGYIPHYREELEELQRDHKVVTDVVINQVLEEAFGFIPGLALDMTCRRAVCALGMVDTNDFLSTKGKLNVGPKTTKTIENSVKTWLEKEDWSNFPKTLVSFIQVLLFPEKKNQLEIIQKRIQKAFTKDKSEELLLLTSHLMGEFQIDID